MQTVGVFIGWLSLTSLMTSTVLAQAPPTEFQVPTSSPRAVVQQRVAATEIEVAYSRPSARGREIFGALVPYGQVWRTGADSATKISFSTPVRVGDAELDAGTYELFSVPGADEWTVIFHEHRSQWGSYRYDPANDVARVAVEPVTLRDPVETFTIAIDDLERSEATLSLSWDRVRVPVPISIDVRATVVPQLEAALEGDGRRPYFRAAMFYFDHGLDVDRAAELMAKALEADPAHIGMLYRQALILERKGDLAGAIDAAERSLAGAAESPPELRDEYTRLSTALLERLRQNQIE